PTGLTAFTASFSATVSYFAKTSNRDAGSASSITFPVITRQFEQRTGALRVLVVPMGDATQTYATQFDATDQSVTQNGVRALSRMLPVPDGVSDLSSTSTGGVRYRIAPTLLDLRTLFNAQGKFCGTASNFDAIKAQ